MGVMRNAYKILVKEHEGEGHLGDPCIDRIILKLFIKNRLGCIWLRKRSSDGVLTVNLCVPLKATVSFSRSVPRL
jgi:hypothetical protein